jgi:hypothetical protein
MQALLSLLVGLGQLADPPEGCEDPATVVGTTPVCAEQGPEWLVRIAFNAPPWVHTTLNVVGLLVIVGGVVGYHRSGGLDEELQRAISQNLLVALGCLVATSIVTSQFAWPYLLDVAAGSAVGIGGALALVAGVDRLEALGSESPED